MEVTTAGPLDGEGEVALSLNGTVDNIVGYDLKLAGKVTAQRCPSVVPSDPTAPRMPLPESLPPTSSHRPLAVAVLLARHFGITE